MRIEKGSVLIYRIFDIAHEINLQAVEDLLKDLSKERFRFSRVNNSLLIKNSPLIISLGAQKIKTDYGLLDAQLTAKLWNYGVVSFLLEVNLPTENFTFDDLIKLGIFFEETTVINEMMIEQKQMLKRQISLALVQDNEEWNTYEDFTTYYLQKIEGISLAEEVIEKLPVTRLILAEDKLTPSKSQEKFIRDSFLQYSTLDILVLDWNSSLLVDLTDDQALKECADIIEFSLTHALELRRYDDLLAEKINILNDWFEQKRGFFRKRKLSHSLYKETTQTYIEYSEFFDRIDNSFKTIGDFYYAIVFRAASRKFRLEDWKNSANGKLKMINNLAEKLDGERHNKKSLYLDVIIVGLFLLETYPLIWKIMKFIWAKIEKLF